MYIQAKDSTYLIEQTVVEFYKSSPQIRKKDEQNDSLNSALLKPQIPKLTKK